MPQTIRLVASLILKSVAVFSGHGATSYLQRLVYGDNLRFGCSSHLKFSVDEVSKNGRGSKMNAFISGIPVTILDKVRRCSGNKISLARPARNLVDIAKTGWTEGAWYRDNAVFKGYY